MNRRRLLSWLPWLVGIVLLVLIVRSVSLAEIVGTLRQLRLWQIGALLLLNAFILATITGRWWLLLRGFGHHVPIVPLFAYRLAAFGLSYFTPGPHVGGEMIQVLMVEREQGVPRSDALAAVILDKVIEFSINLTFLLLGIVAILQWRIVPRETGQQAIGLAAALLLAPVSYLAATALGYYPATRWARKLARRWPRFRGMATTIDESETQVGRYFRRQPQAFGAAIAITLIGWAFLIAEYWLMIRFLGVSLSLPQLVGALTAARLSILMFLPAGLGVLEAGQAAAFTLLGLAPTVGISAALLIRLRDMALGLLGLWWLGRHRLLAQRRTPGDPPPLSRN
ncbi:MAG: flippase-like domain-containing protein [Candidatus Promineofilum sp.]|nr:flippase-like domain-containing protein [Promineifilum sp.]